MNNNQLKTKNGVLQFNQDSFIINDQVSWWERKGRVLFALLLVVFLTLTSGIINNNTYQLTIGGIGLAILSILGVFSVNSYKGRNEFDFNLVQTKFVRSVVIKRNPLNRYLSIIIFLPLNKYRVVQCTQGALDDSGFIAFLKSENIAVILP